MERNGKANGHKIKPKVIAIIQARMLSRRLPGKALLHLAGKPILAHVMERVKLIEGIDNVILATCAGEENKPLLELANSMDIKTYSGSVGNVLERFYLISEKYESEYIVRITADNPFTDVDYASMIIDIALESKFDLCSVANLPLGTAVEVIKKEAIDEAYKSSDKPYHFEHVTTYIKEHPGLFSIDRPAVEIKKAAGKLRLTVDTQEDYEFAKILYDNLYNNKPFPLIDIINYVNDHKEILLINSGIKQRVGTFSAN